MKTKLIALFVVLPAFVFGAANDIIINQKNSTDTGTIPRTLTTSASAILGTDSSGVPAILTTSAVLDRVGSTRGSVLYRGASGWAALTPGAVNTALVSNGVGADPGYAAVVNSITGAPGQVTASASTGALILSLPSALTGIQSITGLAGNMTITAGTGNSRTLALQSTTSGGVATTFLTGNADQSVTFAGAVSGISTLGASGVVTLTNATGATSGGAGGLLLSGGLYASKNIFVASSSGGAGVTTGDFIVANVFSVSGSNGNVYTSGQIVGKNGTAASPAFCFSSAGNAGLYNYDDGGGSGVGFAANGSSAGTINHLGNWALVGSVTTGAPTSGSAGAIKFGATVSGVALAASTTTGWRVNVGGSDITVAVLTTNP